LVEQALSHLGSPDARQSLASLRAQTETCPISDDPEFVDAWADDASVQVRAITVHADPVDMGTEEARDFAQRILAAIDVADG
jgi:hypothetical protein